jgi:hypothetical protein
LTVNEVDYPVPRGRSPPRQRSSPPLLARGELDYQVLVVDNQLGHRVEDTRASRAAPARHGKPAGLTPGRLWLVAQERARDLDRESRLA